MVRPEGPPSSRVLRSRLLPWLVLMGGLAIALAGWQLVRMEIGRQNLARFERLQERVRETIQARFQLTDQALFSGREWVRTQGAVSHGQWAAYVDAGARFYDRGVVGLGIVQRVERAGLEALEAQVRADGLPDFKAERRGNNPFLYIVTHIEPRERNAGAL